MNIKPNGIVEISCGHIYGKQYGLRDAEKARRHVLAREWELVSSSRWHIRGDKGGLRHGVDSIYRIIT